jgi:hypothetical protein
MLWKDFGKIGRMFVGNDTALNISEFLKIMILNLRREIDGGSLQQTDCNDRG